MASDNQNKRSNTPYDDTFRTMIVKGGNLRIPFINEMFRLTTPIPMNTPIENIHNEYFIDEGQGKQSKIITDSVLHIDGKTYHIECQTLSDGTILVRMFQYDFNIAITESVYENYHLTVNIPTSGVLFLRRASDVPDQMTITINTRNGSIDYPVEVMNLSDYTLDDLIQKKLLFLFPFYMFNLEHEFKGFENNNEESREKVITSFNDLLRHVNELYSNGTITVDNYLLITDMLKKVTDSLTQKYDRVRKELDEIMGGQIIEFKGEKLIKQGKEEQAKDVAERMIRKGKYPDTEIADISGLTVSQVTDLREEMKSTAMA